MNKFRFFLKSFLGIMFFYVILFIAAGKIDYKLGWIYLGLSVLGLILDFIIVGTDIELVKEREKPGKGAKEWDKKILGFSALLTLVAYTIAGLDSGRFNWSANIDWIICSTGIILTIIGQLLFLSAKKTNKFFSSVVRIQNDRGHSVCDKGLYKIVRHPGYSGMITSWIGFPFLMASLWSIIPVSMAIILLLVRTKLEDNLLIKELSGYSDYAKKTRYRLVPWIW